MSLAHVPYAFLHGLGRPDITAKFHVVELIMFIALGWFLISRMGIIGAAIAWSLRAGLDAILLFWASWKTLSLDFSSLSHNGFVRAVVVLAGLTATSLLVRATFDGIWVFQIIAFLLLIIIFAVFTWLWCLEQTERELFSSRLVN